MRESASSVTGRQLAIVVMAIVVLAGAYFAARRIMQPPTQAPADAGRASADEFLKLVHDGQAGLAWDSATSEFKSIEGRESFIRKVKATAILREPFSFSSMQQVAVHDSPRSEVLYTSSKSGGTVRVLIGYEGGDWRVDRLTH